MARKLMVSDTVQVPVTVMLAGMSGKAKTHKFSLICKRLDGDELQKQMTNTDYPAKKFLADITSGWANQDLVMEEDEKTPSEFSQDAYADLLSIAGVPALCVQAYLKEVIAKEKN